MPTSFRYSTIRCQFGEKPPLYPLKPEFAWRVHSRVPSRVQSFKEVAILQGVEFRILLFAWDLQHCSANALPLNSLSWSFAIFARAVFVVFRHI